MPDRRIAVVGAGVFGSWIALLAARAGFETILIDQYGPANELSSSAGPTRIIRRAYGADEIYTLFAQRSLELWTAFFGRRESIRLLPPHRRFMAGEWR
ncbi:MAG: FAD-dependent oxidoreductase [Bryobacteraceae bacterium]|jgi:glycine/D-amino acid oxidase-like deaminating enzyme